MARTVGFARPGVNDCEEMRCGCLCIAREKDEWFGCAGVFGWKGFAWRQCMLSLGVGYVLSATKGKVGGGECARGIVILLSEV